MEAKSMKVLYLIQTHKNPEQIYRLVNTIKKSSSGAYILISHNFDCSNLDATLLRKEPNVEVISRKGGRGNFALLQGYLDAIDWIFHNNIEFDWLVNITGQDYPTQPVSNLEKLLAETQYDGLMEYFNVLDYDPREWQDRYFYQYTPSGESLSLWQRAIVKLPRMVINNLQSFVRLNTFSSLRIGLKAKKPPFNQKFSCYGGSYFMTLSRKCVEYLYQFSHKNPGLIRYYENTSLPDESYIQTVLVNSGLFKFCNDNKRYIDWNGARYGHPQILTTNNYSAIVKTDTYFARKFDMALDSKILDLLDATILSELPCDSEAVSCLKG
jgi:hypothetical protein